MTDISNTFEYENGLPKFPIPTIDNTLNQLLKSLEPLYYADGYYKHPLDLEQIQELNKIFQDFKTSTISNLLQKRLIDFNIENDCYLDKLHLDINNHHSNTIMDMTNDDILPRNPFLILANDAIKDISQQDRAAVLIHSSLKFISALRKNILQPDYTYANISSDSNDNIAFQKKYLSMKPYLKLFGTTRCPVFEEGEIEHFDLNKKYSYSDTNSMDWSEDDEEEEETDKDRNLEQKENKNSRPVTRDGSITLEDESLFTSHGITYKNCPDSKHILIISRGQYYTLDVLDTNDCVVYTDDELSLIFEYIINDSNLDSKKLPSVGNKNNMTGATALGSLTSYSYKNWKYARKRLEKRYPNELNLIDAALFVLVLDDTGLSGNSSIEVKDNLDGTSVAEDGDNSSDDCKRLFYGTSTIDENGNQVGSCISRWYDKLQIVVTTDAKAAIIWDSFTSDGSVVLRFISEAHAESVLRLARNVNEDKSKFSLWPTVHDPCYNPRSNKPNSLKDDLPRVVKKIDWSFSHILNTHIHLSETKLADLISKHDITKVSVPFGKKTAQKLGVKPDSMIQVALQVAHYALYGRFVYGYEPVSTRSFKNARSVFINLQSQDILELCQEFISNSLEDLVKLDKFINSCHIHGQKVKEAKEGNGFERHFNALKYVYKFHEHFGITASKQELQIAKNLFENPLLTPFSSPELIFANCGNTATTTFGITPAIPQGYGIGYIIKDEQCDLTVTSQFRQGKRLMFMLNWVLHEIRTYFRKSRNLGRGGIRVNPLVDKLYAMDNAKYASKLNAMTQGSGHSSNNTNGFFDLKGHMESRTVSGMNSHSNSSLALNQSNKTYSSMINSKEFNEAVMSLNIESKNQNGPTEEEKLGTGSQIPSLQPNDEESDSDENTRNVVTKFGESGFIFQIEEQKTSNVIDSKFDIDFDRGRVGRKIVSFE
ncbi:hypothetical protein TPHA_0I03070 [Tetrapisispora phaffii CBS 4417]|uniref:Choline/carnitine acyltransferase domain-containing protein n=1 Tax=Tetrapisispora phaffii (strain ATCC 24235 / CBS 4417 / NBRC 1672 / NRRL Y-8282 / UCD 70-5) TaxID=1071381 RepID=G8BY30_TETPH|nr:hypothetical protein TPHA_0I03070 [Tetrapisispora phaffii CBS 4417]CCE64808.1 hypothetical protein TPHA_0I03070 [Tetrapisispora phaffii CBS 4417]